MRRRQRGRTVVAAGTARQHLPRAAGHGQLQPRYLARTAQRPTRRVVFHRQRRRLHRIYLPLQRQRVPQTQKQKLFSGITAFRLPEILNQ